ncbi:MAG: hypothetical protein OEY89_09900 [Gammaproteobacteria bacterium]|nr:hypothetical protein [Gammaproteobacteria bacterium]
MPGWRFLAYFFVAIDKEVGRQRAKQPCQRNNKAEGYSVTKRLPPQYISHKSDPHKSLNNQTKAPISQTQKNPLKSRFLNMVPKAGLEPARYR